MSTEEYPTPADTIAQAAGGHTAAEALAGAARLGEHLRHAGIRVGSPAADQDLPPDPAEENG